MTGKGQSREQRCRGSQSWWERGCPQSMQLCRVGEKRHRRVWAIPCSLHNGTMPPSPPAQPHPRSGSSAPSAQHVSTPNSRFTWACIPHRIFHVALSTTKQCNQLNRPEPTRHLTCRERATRPLTPGQKSTYKRELKYDEIGPLDNSEKYTPCFGNQCLKWKTKVAGWNALRG